MLESTERHAGGHDRIYEILLRQIVEGVLGPGTRLVQGRLAERLGVSRTPVREALFRLHQEGFVLTTAGRGFSVRPLDEEEARELFPILSALEGLALSLAGPLLALDVEALREANRALAPLGRKPLEAIEADTAFHQLLLRRCPNRSLLEMVDGVRRRLLRYEYVYMADETLIDVSIAQHEAIIDRISRCDFDGAAKALDTNYESGKALVLSKLRRR
ncbi:MAG TPA: GntR family transcriptional regulator [Sphingomicrobium sp.]|nr:GntR family transcriptional regulator [Sphingomicrobium sp.]